MQWADQCRPAYWRRGKGNTKLIFMLYLTNIFCKHYILNPPPPKKKKKKKRKKNGPSLRMYENTRVPPPPPPWELTPEDMFSRGGGLVLHKAALQPHAGDW